MEQLAVREISCRSVLHRLDFGSAREYTANFYKGCSHGCVYCYVPSLIHDDRTWGSFVDVKVNAPVVLERELSRVKKGVVFLSSATDPYQAMEGRYKITRRSLRALHRRGFPVVILTRSPLVLRDIDLLRRFEWVRVGFSISSVPDRFYEPRVPPLERRIDCLRRLTEVGIKTWVSMAPIIPGRMLIDLRKTIEELKAAGVSSVSPGLLRFQGYDESRTHFEKSTGESSTGLLEGGEELIAEAREEIGRCGFEPLEEFFDWHPNTELDQYLRPIS